MSRLTYQQAIARAFLNALDGESTLWKSNWEMKGQAGVKSDDEITETAYCKLLAKVGQYPRLPRYGEDLDRLWHFTEKEVL